ncbi:hypothetical protein [Rhizobium rhizogenes]|uniref:hypothetical protein n=1 Tax=Rhizobium rhizogenes TaxID=359 RepID=UPI0004D40C4A|nr:hypothetical protein [Rhizobium rhizogenes]KEA07158.1 hypothetical protein CN09_09460 [Rhizobium rhizogenes]NTI80403.1 hypothetical protein [Rhizobium rhizogenes]NTJ22589.1 hypothetical protein [Rhizobium rhizogenes]QUE81295.1 hypothetical protein EML492_05665 [Rhizobium rhizogenes]TQO80606.1 hypothetical protein FFE80_05755 [Rhizobium rhizogenes]
MDIEKLALELATLVKGAGDEDYDFGNFAHYLPDAAYDDEGNGLIWSAICERAEELLPTITVTREERVRWSRASREFSACERYEAQQLGYGA